MTRVFLIYFRTMESSLLWRCQWCVWLQHHGQRRCWTKRTNISLCSCSQFKTFVLLLFFFLRNFVQIPFLVWQPFLIFVFKRDWRFALIVCLEIFYTFVVLNKSNRETKIKEFSQFKTNSLKWPIFSVIHMRVEWKWEWLYFHNLYKLFIWF